MKNKILAALALVSALGLTAPAKASSLSWNFLYVGDDGVTATGTLVGSQSIATPWAYLLTGGTIQISGAPNCTDCNTSGTPEPLNGFGTLVTDVNEVAQIGGGTTWSGQDNLLFPGVDPALDGSGLVFQLTSPACVNNSDACLGLALWANGPGSYSALGGNFTFLDSGTLTVTPTPEPNSFLLFGTGLLGLGCLFLAKRQSRGLSVAA